MQPLPGFRDFLPQDCAVRNYVFDRWREVARRYGFIEWDGPVLEPTELYRKKSGDEIVGQLFNFTDKGDREVALRMAMPVTPAEIASDGSLLGSVGGVVTAVESEVAQRGELALDPVQPRGVAGRVDQFDLVISAPAAAERTRANEKQRRALKSPAAERTSARRKSPALF